MVLALLPSCSASKAPTSDLEAEDEATDEDGDTLVDQKKGGLAHPRKPTAWDVRTLTSTIPQPRADAIRGCIEQVAQLAAEAGNAEDMLAATAQIAESVGHDVALYHYCFYQMSQRLDERLDLGGPLMTDLANTFLTSTRELWLLARSLEKITKDDRYFTYLQARYIQLSHDYFGRDVQIVAPPLGTMPKRPAGEQTGGSKPAGAAPDL